ncbi:MAG: rod shape-determining protein MreC [Gemmatimonadota bacterium]|nr:MAG: rod shape-determining protein MreC [Gemmatimonadota bacterium]
MGDNSDTGLKRFARRDIFFLLFFLMVAVVLETLPRERQLALATATRSTVLAPILKLHAAVYDWRATRAGLAVLRAERDSLAANFLALQGVREENRRLRDLLGLAERREADYIPANLYPASRAGEGATRSFALDVGSADGVRIDAPVIAPGGLVGVVRAVGRHRVIGDFWTHPDFRVSAMTNDGGVFGIIRPLGGSRLLMQLEGAPYQTELSAGTELITSGQGGIFPRGIPVGRVLQLMGAEVGWSKRYLVEPAAYPDGVREVMVVILGESAEVNETSENTAELEGRNR